MTQFFTPDGRVVPATALQAGPCVVVQRKTSQKDGYEAVQLGLVEFVKAGAGDQAGRSGTSRKRASSRGRLLRELRLDGDAGRAI